MTVATGCFTYWQMTAWFAAGLLFGAAAHAWLTGRTLRRLRAERDQLVGVIEGHLDKIRRMRETA